MALGLTPTSEVAVFIGSTGWVHDACKARIKQDMLAIGWMPDRDGDWPKRAEFSWPVKGALVAGLVELPSHAEEAMLVSSHIASGRPLAMILVGQWPPHQLLFALGVREEMMDSAWSTHDAS